MSAVLTAAVAPAVKQAETPAASPGFGIAPHSLAKLRALFAATPGIERVWIFGSRAQGAERPESDIDLAVDAPGWDAVAQLRLTDALNSQGLLYRVDMVFSGDRLDAGFRAQIERVRRVFWEPQRRAADLQAVGGVDLKDFQRNVLKALSDYVTELQRQRAQTEAQASAVRAMEGPRIDEVFGSQRGKASQQIGFRKSLLVCLHQHPDWDARSANAGFATADRRVGIDSRKATSQIARDPLQDLGFLARSQLRQ